MNSTQRSCIRRTQSQKMKITYDEDFPAFKQEVKELTISYHESKDEQEKSKIRQKLHNAMNDCRQHMGWDIKYNVSQDVANRFRRFYTPRYKLLQRAFSSIQ